MDYSVLEFFQNFRFFKTWSLKTSVSFLITPRYAAEQNKKKTLIAELPTELSYRADNKVSVYEYKQIQ